MEQQQSDNLVSHALRRGIEFRIRILGGSNINGTSFLDRTKYTAHGEKKNQFPN